MPTQKGSVKLFRLAGIDVYLHWSWFIAFFFLVQLHDDYSNYGWSALLVLALFFIVLIHEFGHALACRSVGGQANLIVLWPLGGVAYVNPPQRPGAQLWSIAAGPLVNAALVPLLAGTFWLANLAGWATNHPDAYLLIKNINLINLILLVFNLFPVYPLDGGQILRSILWFLFGRANSLLAASIIGFIGVAGLFAVSALSGSIWLGLIAVFILLNCWGGLMQARALGKMAKIPRREGFTCPSCRTSPPLGAVWRCGQCNDLFDIFASSAHCPHCGATYQLIQCIDCGTRSSVTSWQKH